MMASAAMTVLLIKYNDLHMTRSLKTVASHGHIYISCSCCKRSKIFSTELGIGSIPPVGEISVWQLASLYHHE